MTLTCLPFMDGNLYGDTGGGWCWIKNTNTTGKVGSGAGGIGLTQLSEQVLRFVCFYGWLWLVIILIVIMYYQLLRVVRRAPTR